MNLVVIPFHDWKKCEREGFRTRDAHLMQEFSKHPLVDNLLIINRPISLSEIILFRRNWCVKKGKLLVKKNGVYLSQVAPKTFTLDIIIPEIIRPIIMRRNWIPYIFNHQKVIKAISFALNSLNIEHNYALLMSAPLFVPLIKNISPKVWGMDAQDNLLKQSLYCNVPNLEQYYQYCQDNADIISANSLETTNWLAQQRADITYIPNGVDTNFFNHTKNYPIPEDIKLFNSPIVGYAGKIQEMFDIDVMEQAIKKFPDVNFIFIGQQLKPKLVHHLWKYPNAHHLGDKDYITLPNYLATFDICIIPYDVKRQHGGDPIKFYEYIAMGKPIITTNIGGVSAFQDYPQVEIVNTTKEFINSLKKFLKMIKKNNSSEKRPIPTECLWQTKANQILEDINIKLDSLDG